MNISFLTIEKIMRDDVLIQLESRLVLFEDLARQVLTYGMREDMHTTCARIEAVTKSDAQQLAVKALYQTAHRGGGGCRPIGDAVPRRNSRLVPRNGKLNNKKTDSLSL